MFETATDEEVDQSTDDLMLPLPMCDQPIEDAYAIDSVIGEGSYSTVHAARSRCSGECVVVKAVQVDTLDPDERQVALQEAQTLSHLRHTNIIRYHDVRYSREQSALYIVMEHAAGGDLGDMIQQRATQKRHFSEEFILLTFVQITLALSHVHARGFLHRDIKSSNVFLLGHDDIVKLGDFGLATMIRPNGKPLSSTPVGTPYYRSPEVCEKKPYTEKSDIWSLGCLLYELTTLKRAFGGSTMSALMVNILMGRFSPVPSRFSVHLCSLIRSMLSHNPARRPTTDDILKLPWMQPYLQQYSELMRKQLPEVRWPRASDASSCSADTMTLAMPPMLQPVAPPVASNSSGVTNPQPGSQHAASRARTKAACKEVRRMLGNVQASLSARLKETPTTAGAHLRNSLTKGKAAVTAGARMKASASQRIRSFCLSDVEDVHIAPVLRQMRGASTSHACSSAAGPGVPAVPVETATAAGDSGDAAQPVLQDANPALGDLSSLSSLSSVCSQPTRSKDDDAPWGSIVPVHGLTLCSPQTKSVDQMQSSTSLPAQRARPRTPLLLHHSVAAGVQPCAGGLEVVSDAFAEPSGSACSPDPGNARAQLRSAHEMARNTHKDSRHANGQRLVSKAWLQNNFAALDQMQGALTRSMELRQTSALERCCSRSCVSSRTSPVPTIATEISTATSAGGRATDASVTPSPRNRVGKPSPRIAVQTASPLSPRTTPGSHFSSGGQKPKPTAVVSAGSRSRTSLGTGRYGAASPESPAGAESASGRHKRVRTNHTDVSAVASRSRTAARATPANPLRRSLQCAQQQEGLVNAGRCRGIQGHGGGRPVRVARSQAFGPDMKPVKESSDSKVRSQWGSIRRPAVQKRESIPQSDQPTKAQERAAERRRGAEVQAAHRLALKQVKARVRREDILKVGAGTAAETSHVGWKCSSRPDAPAFVIPAVSAAQKAGSGSSEGAPRPCSGGNNEKAPVQQRVRAQRRPVPTPGKRQLHEHSVAAQVPVAGSGATPAPRVALKERLGVSMLHKHGTKAQATGRGDPAVEIFLPRYSLPVQTNKVGDVKACSSAPVVNAQSSNELPPLEVAVAQQPTEVGECAHKQQGIPDESCVKACHASSGKPHGPQATAGQNANDATVTCPESAVTSNSLDRSKGNLSSRERACGPGSLTSSKTRGAQAPKAAWSRKGGADAASSSGRKGSGSAPGRLRSPERRSASGGRATAARVEELRIRLEAQLGPEKLLTACKSLESNGVVTSSGNVMRQLEAVLAPQTHFAYAVYRLKMMEDIVFK